MQKDLKYDEHLLFESMNEEFDGSYSEPNKEYYQNINDYNQIFVDTVRKTGDNNTIAMYLLVGLLSLSMIFISYISKKEKG